MFGMCKTKRSSKCKRCLFIISNIDIIWSIRTPPEFNYQLWTSYKIFLSLKYLFHFFLTSCWLYLFNKYWRVATDSCRDGWNVRNGLNVPKILHSVDGRVDRVLLLVLVVLLSKHICDLIPNKKHCKSLCWGKYMNLLMLLWKTGCIGCLECQNILVINRVVLFLHSEIKVFALNLYTVSSRCSL